MIKCRVCGLVQTWPMPSFEELQIYYSSFAFLPPAPEDIEEHLASIGGSLEFHVGKPAPNTTFLDYGGGYGLYAKAASQLGYQASLYDYDQGAVEFASRQLEIAPATSDLSSFPDQCFDLIWAYHVIEHWNDIDKPFDDISRLLKPGGRLVIATPNARGWEKYLRPAHFKYYYQAWRKRGLSPFHALKLLLSYDSVFCWDPPRHLYAYTPESLHRIGARRGYSTELRVGANTDPNFEPRRYIIASPANRFHSLSRQMLKRPWKLGAALAILKLGVEQLSFRIMACVAPNGGEQLYMVFTKK